MKITMTLFNYVKVDDTLQLSFIKGNVGDVIIRHKLEEQPHADKLSYLDNYKIQQNLSNHILLNGKIKVSYKWQDDENITQQDVDKILEINKSYPEEKSVTHEVADNSYSYTGAYNGDVSEWLDRSFKYELASSFVSIESLEDDTVMICIIPNEYGWKVKNIDIPPNQSATFTREDATTYLLPCDTCEVTNEDNTHTFNQYDIKKLTKDNEYSIKNVSDKICKVIVICR
tara:strand:+ start:810 stop:1496 length:687 start_codon:yes stop_codon:yes gene_type:complete